MSRPGPETGCYEAAVELLAGVGTLWFCGGLVSLLGLLVVPLLLVGEDFYDDEDEHEAGEDIVVDIKGIFVARGEEEDVGWGRDHEEQEL